MTQIITPKKQRLEVADILHKHIDDYKNQYCLWPQHKKIVSDLLNCRTAQLGGQIERCNNCGTVRITYHSCRNRHARLSSSQAAPNVSTCPEKGGLKNEKTRSYRSATFMSSLPCRTS